MRIDRVTTLAPPAEQTENCPKTSENRQFRVCSRIGLVIYDLTQTPKNS